MPGPPLFCCANRAVPSSNRLNHACRSATRLPARPDGSTEGLLVAERDDHPMANASLRITIALDEMIVDVPFDRLLAYEHPHPFPGRRKLP